MGCSILSSKGCGDAHGYAGRGEVWTGFHGPVLQKLYHQRIRDRWSRKYHRGVQKGKALKKRQKHIDRARGRGCSTRIVLDPVEVWQNTGMAEARGWTAWIKMSNDAKNSKTCPLPTSQPNGLFSGDARLRLRARNDRYPPLTISTMTDSEDRRIKLNRNIRLTRGRSGMDTVHAASGFQRKI